MNLRTFILAIALILMPLVSNIWQGTETTRKYNKEVYELSSKIHALKDKYHLKYRSYDDLVETCDYIVRYSHFSNFNKYDISAIVMKESKFDQYAHNKKDGGVGYGQITGLKKGWHDDTLFWLEDPYNKEQNIRGIYYVLQDNLKSHKTKFTAIKRYNGKTHKSTVYAQSVTKMSKELKEVKV